ncbi:MAG: hypothetical protein FWE28_01970 [Oscillospiraceae bacterium]|nr:hypothetical protein [Oscillospiraceae bacterium]
MAIIIMLLIVNGICHRKKQSKSASVSVALLPLIAVLFFIVQGGAVELSTPVFVVLAILLMGGAWCYSLPALTAPVGKPCSVPFILFFC